MPTKLRQALISYQDYHILLLTLAGQGALDAHNKWHVYDGNHAHCTVPFAGKRFSFVFFTESRYTKCPAAERAFLEGTLGFPWPHDGGASVRQDYGTSVERVRRGSKAYRAWLDGEECEDSVEEARQSPKSRLVPCSAHS